MRLSFSLLWISDDRGQSLVAEDCPLVRQGIKYATVEHHPAGKLWRGRTISNPEIVLTGKTADAVKVQCESLIEAWATARQNCIALTLQWPPSVNHYWRTARGVHYISAEGRNFRKHTEYAVLEQLRRIPKLDGRLWMEVLAYPPDKRLRDIDNLLKAPLDALASARVYEDDSQIDDLRISRRGVVKDGKIVVRMGEE